MSPQEHAEFVKALYSIGDAVKTAAATRPYTLTGAADWPLLLVVGGGLIVAVIAMWTDLKSTFRESRGEVKVEFDKVWGELRRIEDAQVSGDAKVADMVTKCQDRCCE